MLYRCRLVPAVAFVAATAVAAEPATLRVAAPLATGGIDRTLADTLGTALGRTVSVAPAGTDTAGVALMSRDERQAAARSTPAGLFGTAPMVLVARSSLPALDGAELIAAAKAGGLRVAHGGGASEACATLFGAQVGTLARVAGEPLKALADERADVACLAAPMAVPLAKSGAVTAHIVAAEERLAALWDVPTAGELGVPLFTAATWFGLYVTAPADAAKAHSGLQTFLGSEANLTALAAVGVTPFPMTHRALEAHATFEADATR